MSAPDTNPHPTSAAHSQSTPRLLQLQITSLTGELWKGPVREVSLPGTLGRFGVMARHLPMLSTLKEGMIHIRLENGENIEVYVSGGYAEVQPDKVTVMADLAVRDDDLDHARAQAARELASSPMAQNFTDAAYAQLHMELIHRYSANLRHPKLR